MKSDPSEPASSPKERILPYRTQDSEVDGLVPALQDIVAVKSDSEQLANSVAFFRGIIETIREPLLVLDHDQRVVAANESFLSTFDVTSEQTIKRTLDELGNGQWNIAALRKLLDRVLPEKEIVTDFEVDHEFENIGHRKMMLNARRITQPNQSKPMILLAIEDMTGRGEMLETLLASEERFRTLFNLGPVAIYYCDAAGAIQNFNRRAAELWGRIPKAGDTDEQFCGSYKLFRPDGIFMPHDQCPMAEVLNGTIQEARDQEVLIERPDGSRVVVVVNIRVLKNSKGEIAGAINCFYDITDRKLSEAALIKSEKLAAAGRLAATLAHEINNPLQAVANLLDMWSRSPGLDAQNQAYAAMAESELRRVTHLTRQSLSFYRESALPAPVNVEETVDSVLNIYEKRIRAKRIHITRRYLTDGMVIKTYPGEMRQVFSTLLLNAMEAVDAGGAIAVRIRKASHWQNPEIRGVRVSIFDNGVGIPAPNISRIFEPFFTTKGDNGTGLGLWVTSGIVNRFGGSILTRSSVHPSRHGTCFSIFLPTKS